MAEKLADLLVPVAKRLGFRQGWGIAASTLIREGLPVDLEGLTISQSEINSVLSCGLMWQVKEVTPSEPDDVYFLRRALFVKVTREFIEAAVIGKSTKPMEFVRDFLDTEANFDPLTNVWLFLQKKRDRIELRASLVEAIVDLLDSWPNILDGTQVATGPVIEDVAIGDAVFSVDTVDLTVGEHREDKEVNWAGAVLVRFMPHFPNHKDLEDMALGALIHGIATGCPPRRLVVWGLQSHMGLGLDVTRELMNKALANTQMAIKKITDIRNDRGITVVGGEHCLDCPLNTSCDLSVGDEYPF